MRANIHIRKENEEKWNQLTNKSEFINNALAGSPPSNMGLKVPPVKKVIKTPEDAKFMAGEFNAIHFCKHGSAIGFCKFGCRA